MRILVAEDEYLIRTLITVLLSESGHEVIEARDGATACRLLEKTDAIEMIVTDYIMPGADGGTVAQRARRLEPHMPVLFVTGFAGLHAIRDLPQPYRCLAKPFTPDDFMTALRGMYN
jgi:CheY-like chemotaxis protein